MRDANVAGDILQDKMPDLEDFDMGDGSGMDIDFEQADTTVPNITSDESTANARDVDSNAESASSVANSMTARQLRKISRRRENNKRKKEIKAYAAAPYMEGRNFKCTFCPRMFDRAGILMHLYGIIIVSFCSAVRLTII
jgi:hypothetical protein